MVETITWVSVDKELPDEDIMVLVKTTSLGESVWFGYLDSGVWTSAEGFLAVDVRFWAEMPAGPKIEQTKDLKSWSRW